MNQNLYLKTVFTFLCMWGILTGHTQTIFEADLSGRNEVLPITSTAFGAITAVLEGDVLTVTGEFDGLTGDFDANIAGGSHIHNGLTGQNGPIELTLVPVLEDDLKSGSFEADQNTFVLSQEQLDALQSRSLYINIHTTRFPGGELRGQLRPQADEAYLINLFGSNEVPSIMTGASGALLLEVNGDELTVTGSFSNLEGDFDVNIAGGAHLHFGYAGQNGGIAIPINANLDADLRSGTFDISDNTFSADAETLNALAERRIYANIHTTAFPSGELRGQAVDAATITLFRAHLSGSNEVPVVTSLANGTLLLEVTEETLMASGAFAGLESDLNIELAGGAHIHEGAAGETGAIEFLLTALVDADNRNGAFAISDNSFQNGTQITNRLYERGYYVNIHSMDNAPGELRGQLLPESQIVFNGFLSGIFEVPEVGTQGLGAMKGELTGNQLSISGSFGNLSSEVDTNILGGAHLHLGFAGATGGVEVVLNPDLAGSNTEGRFLVNENTFMLTDEQVAALRARQIYANIHTTTFSTGELRAQMLPEANTYFVAHLSGGSEAPDPVNTFATGMTVLEINGNRGVFTGAFLNLGGDFAFDIAGGAHIHEGIAGSNGPIAQFLNATVASDNRNGVFEAPQNVFEVSEGFVDSLRTRMRYVNIHSELSLSGEIRGQLLPLATAYFTVSLSGLNEVDPIITTANGGLKLELTGNLLTVTGSFTDLQSPFNPDIAGGAHIHNGKAGENGPIVVGLNTELSTDALSGRYLATENTFELTNEEVTALFDNYYYVNIHTQDTPSGELRGQVLTEINRFPFLPPSIVQPANGSAIVLDGDQTTPFEVIWTGSIDRDPMAYIWQLAADSDFNDILFQTNVGPELMFTSDFGTVNSLLAAAGLEIGETITLFHRPIASDGSLNLLGVSASVDLTRGGTSGADLEISITAPFPEYQLYETQPYSITVRNLGPEEATGVTVSAGLPFGMVFTSASPSQGVYSLFFETWDVGSIASGDSATLELVLFPLIENTPITNFVQVLTSDQSDPDSTPGNDTDNTPDEDDEAALTLESGDGVVIGNEGEADLELSIDASNDRYEIFSTVTYTLTLTNLGPDPAEDVVVAAGLPEGMVFSSYTATGGIYTLFFERWEVEVLNPGETVELNLVLFTLQDDGPISNYVQVIGTRAGDPDSTPDNNPGPDPIEDDEAAITILPVNSLLQGGTINTSSTQLERGANVYPNPTTEMAVLEYISEESTSLRLALINEKGQLVKYYQWALEKGLNTFTIKLTDQPAGQYWLVGDEGKLNLSLVKLSY